MRPDDSVAGLGEDAVLGAILPQLPVGDHTQIGPGDDCAVLGGLQSPVVTTDVLVEGRHFRHEYCSAFDIGWRAAIANLADVVSMGAWPVCLVVALVLPGSTSRQWVTDLARGLAGPCRGLARDGGDVGIVGGDLAGGESVVVSVTAIGDLGAARPVLRSGARRADILAVAGDLGWSAAGLALLQAGRQGADEHEQRALAAFRRPSPPLDCGPQAAAWGASAMMDISDGLARDAARMARASAVSLRLDPGALQARAAPLRQLAEQTGATALDWVLGGGEDHALLATFPPGRPLPAGFTAIGVADDPGEEAVTMAGQGVAQRGWDHFAR